MKLALKLALKPALSCFAASLAIISADPALAKPGDVFARGAAVEKIWSEGRFTEGVDVAPDGRVYFTDMTWSGSSLPPQTLVFDPGTRKVAVLVADNGNSNGQKIGPDGRLWSAQSNGRGTRDIRVVALDGSKREIAVSGYAGRPFNAPNDLAFDAAGRMYLTDTRYLESEVMTQPLNAIYRIDRDGQVTLLVTDMLAPNGIAISPDGRTLYASEHPYRSADPGAAPGAPSMLPMSIRAYDLTSEGRALHGRVFVDFGLQEGVDGMTVDAAGNLVATFRDDARRGVRVFSPAGKEVDFLPLPDKPTNVAFGKGAERHILYITAGSGLYKVSTKTEGARR